MFINLPYEVTGKAKLLNELLAKEHLTERDARLIDLLSYGIAMAIANILKSK